MSLQEDLEDLAREEFSEYTQGEAEYQEKIVNKVLDAAIQAITDNPHKSAIEAITDMRRKND